jgi:exonuclease III
MSILFWNCNGGHKKEPKRTIISEMTRELKTDIIALVETKSPSAAAPEGFNLISFRNPVISRSQHTNRIHASGGICVGGQDPLC